MISTTRTLATCLTVAATVVGLQMATSAGAAQDPAPGNPSSGDAAAGRQLYYDYLCYGCHGYTGETGARVFVGSRSANLASEEQFVRFLRGRATVSPDLPSTRMPSYAESTLSDGQAKDIYAFIRTFRSHAPPLERIEVMMQILKAAEQ